MIKTSVEKLASEIGYDIGISDDIVQSDLLNGFCKGLANSMNERELNMQLCAIVEKLTPKSMHIIKGLSNFVSLKEKE